MKKNNEWGYYILMVILINTTIYLFYKREADLAIATGIFSLIITVLRPIFYKKLHELRVSNA